MFAQQMLWLLLWDCYLELPFKIYFCSPGQLTRFGIMNQLQFFVITTTVVETEMFIIGRIAYHEVWVKIRRVIWKVNKYAYNIYNLSKKSIMLVKIWQYYMTISAYHHNDRLIFSRILRTFHLCFQSIRDHSHFLVWIHK